LKRFREAGPSSNDVSIAFKVTVNVAPCPGPSLCAAIGPQAAPAVNALMAACSVKDEQIHVLRACAAALGEIGKPAATPALPLLKELAKMPRVRWAAEKAIKNIEGGAKP